MRYGGLPSVSGCRLPSDSAMTGGRSVEPLPGRATELSRLSAYGLLGVVRFLRSGRVLICVVCDDGPAPDEWHSVRAGQLGEPVTEALALGGLTRDEARRHLEALVDRHVPESVAATAFAVTGGTRCISA